MGNFHQNYFFYKNSSKNDEEDDMKIEEEGDTKEFYESSFGNVLNTLSSSVDNN